MKLALAQINPIVGDFEYNVSKILKNIEAASKAGANIVIFPELVLCGYPPKDLLLKKQFISDCKKYLNIIKDKSEPNIYSVIGFPEENNGVGKPLFNSLALIKDKKIIHTRQKSLLPTYDVFDEDRYFEGAKENIPIEILGNKFGLTICEDIWQNDLAWTYSRYNINPIEELYKNKIDFIINSSSSPYFLGKPEIRENLLKKCAKKYKTSIIYVNQVGGNDELIFDGNSCVVDRDGNISLRLKSFEEDLQILDEAELAFNSQLSALNSNIEEELLQAMLCGIRDYVSKCGFKKVIIGLSGGIDSALVTAIATLALGKENVLTVFMPSRYTSEESKNDATLLAKNLSVELLTIPIEEPFKAFLNLLLPLFKSNNSSLAQENIQPRIRGLILMALSNQSRALVLSTGNKSELATGYCTLYGDMCGGLAVISDLPKTIVYKLAKYINEKFKSTNPSLIPGNIINKAPTAELKPNQKDQDVLPSYETLDQILNLYVEEHVPLKEIVKKSIPKDLVEKTSNMIDLSEYKREQAAPGLKLTSRSFGHGWRMPIAKRYKEEI